MPCKSSTYLCTSSSDIFATRFMLSDEKSSDDTSLSLQSNDSSRCCKVEEVTGQGLRREPERDTLAPRDRVLPARAYGGKPVEAAAEQDSAARGAAEVSRASTMPPSTTPPPPPPLLRLSGGRSDEVAVRSLLNLDNFFGRAAMLDLGLVWRWSLSERSVSEGVGE